MDDYPLNTWEEDDLEKMKNCFLYSGTKNISCPAPECDGIVEIHRNDNLKDQYIKRGDFYIDFACSTCGRKGTSSQAGHYKH